MRRCLKLIIRLSVLASIGLLIWMILFGCGAPEAAPVSSISTTLNKDGTTGHNFFRAIWNLHREPPLQVESLRQLAKSIRDEIQSNIDTRVKIWEREYWSEEGYRENLLILETTIDFRDPSEIEGILATVYGRGYGREDISIEVPGPVFGELKTVWSIEMTVNPAHMPRDRKFTWKVNMPGKIKSVKVMPSEASVFRSGLGTKSVMLIFEPEDRFITVSIRAEESEVREKIIWPLVVGIAASIVAAIVLGVGAMIIRRRRRITR